ncbi:MAG: energy transducer TonB [Chitinispirillaceae bacterium]|nr:energy transducer TonB [Chitinispirillaceae bacterium]
MHTVVSAKEVRSFFDSLFEGILVIVLGLMISVAFYFRDIGIETEKKVVLNVPPVQTRFILSQQSPPQMAKIKEIPPEKEEKKKFKEDEIVDLTKKPMLAQKEDDIQENKTVEVKQVRKVFGLKRVYSQGLGAGGNLSDAVFSKLGNTITTEVDTFTATDEELRGQVVSTTTVTKAPRFKKVAKPEYTKDMVDNKIEGVVKLKVLVDIDGKIKKATVLSDIGFNSAQQALAATKEMEFEPAMRGEDAVAVWIVIPIKFIMLS